MIYCQQALGTNFQIPVKAYQPFHTIEFRGLQYGLLLYLYDLYQLYFVQLIKERFLQGMSLAEVRKPDVIGYFHVTIDL